MAQLKTPREFFGKQPGDDRVMIHWDELCAYYREAAKVSDRLILQEKGNCRLYEKMGYRQAGISQIVNERMTLVLYKK